MSKLKNCKIPKVTQFKCEYCNLEVLSVPYYYGLAMPMCETCKNKFLAKSNKGRD